jgi:hypothetical protein
MEEFRQILTPIIEEFKKDVEYRYSLDGWIGRIFIEPIENFVDWLKNKTIFETCLTNFIN